MVRSWNTRAEMIVRKMLHREGFRYRLHRKDLPGKPDIVFPGKRKAVFVHGCFWHRHPGCSYAQQPASNVGYWQAKFDRNVARDIENVSALREKGWDVLIVWECQTRNERSREELLKSLTQFLSA